MEKIGQTFKKEREGEREDGKKGKSEGERKRGMSVGR